MLLFARLAKHDGREKPAPLSDSQVGAIMRAIEDKEGIHLLAAPKLTTKSGCNAEIKIGREIIYVAELRAVKGNIAEQSGDDQLPGHMILPVFEVRDVGVVLNVTPIVGPDRYTVDLTLLPQVVELSEWMEHKFSISSSDGTIKETTLLQPVFSHRQVASSISVYDGQTVVMGGFAQPTDDDGYKHLFIIVSVHLVDSSGKLIREDLNQGLATDK